MNVTLAQHSYIDNYNMMQECTEYVEDQKNNYEIKFPKNYGIDGKMFILNNY